MNDRPVDGWYPWPNPGTPKDVGQESPPLWIKNPHAVALGRLGGLKGGKARMASLSKEERKALSRKGIVARWGDNVDGDEDILDGPPKVAP